MKLAQIADKNDNMETLKQLRHRLAQAIDETNSGRDISSLARQLQIVMSQIAELEKEKALEEEDVISDIVSNRQKVRNYNGRVSRDLIIDEDEDDEE